MTVLSIHLSDSNGRLVEKSSCFSALPLSISVSSLGVEQFYKLENDFIMLNSLTTGDFSSGLLVCGGAALSPFTHLRQPVA